jgi:uncharacterized protein YegP (UPF0339 family)
MKPATFTVYLDKAGLWRWRLVASNGKCVADSGVGYATKQYAQRAVERMKMMKLG